MQCLDVCNVERAFVRITSNDLGFLIQDYYKKSKCLSLRLSLDYYTAREQNKILWWKKFTILDELRLKKKVIALKLETPFFIP